MSLSFSLSSPAQMRLGVMMMMMMADGVEGMETKRKIRK